MRIEFRKLFNRLEFYILFTIGLILAFLSLVDKTMANPFSSFANAPSAFQAAMIYGGSFSEFFSVIFLPVLAVLPYVDQYYSEKYWGVLACEITRQSRTEFFLKKATVVWITSVVSIFAIYVLNQIYCLIAYPVTQTRTYLTGSIYDQYLNTEILHTPTPGLYMNSPFLLNIAHIFFACFYGGAVALSGFALSLYICINKAITNLLPVGIFLIYTFIGLSLFGATFAPALAIIASPVYTITSLLPSIIFVCAVYIVSILAVILKSSRFRDII